MRSFALLAVIAVASAEDATAPDDMLDDYVSMMIRQASSEDGADAESDLDEAIQAKHGHGPHGHGPHGHWPHRHSPHGHNPHGHNPHSHNPHVHTPYPTPNPTPHPCDDGSHGCDTADGVCYKAGGNTWTCGCAVNHHCIAGCSAPHTGHNCVLVTPNPTPYPTPQPTHYPTPHPTAYPTSMPTPAPTTAPTFIGVDEIDAVKKCCEKVIGIDVNYIMPLHTCADVRAGSREDLRRGLHNLEVTKGLDNDDVFDWLHKNRCFHERHDTHFPTPAPTPSPTPSPTPAPTPTPTAWPTFSQHRDHEIATDALTDRVEALEAKVKALYDLKLHLLKVQVTPDTCEVTCDHTKAGAGNDPKLTFAYK